MESVVLQSMADWEQFLKTPEAIESMGAREVNNRRKWLEKKLDRWAGKRNVAGERTGGICCTSTWVDDLRNAADPTYHPSTPCDSASCRKRGTRYPAYYVKPRWWREKKGVHPTFYGFMCDDCWAAWMDRHIDNECLIATGLRGRPRRVALAALTGMTQEEIVEAQGMSQRTIQREFAKIRDVW